MSAQPDVVVLGGGIVGVASAYFLAQQGCRVTLLESRDGSGLGTSFANGGLMTPSMSDPWAAPGLPLKLLKWMGREHSPFLVRPGALPGLIGWGMAFLKNCTETRWRENAAVVYRLSAYSQKLTAALRESAELRYDSTSRGTLRLFRDELSMATAAKSAGLVGALGCRYEELSGTQCAEIEPALRSQTKHLTGGIYFPDDESGDAHKLTGELSARCADLGVSFRYGVTVQRLQTTAGRVTGVATSAGPIAADSYVLALGCASPMLLKPLGIKLPIYPVKGYSVTLSVKGWNGAPVVPLVDDGRKMGITRLGDRLRLAGTAEFAGHDNALNRRRGQMLLASLGELFPDFSPPGEAQQWTGLRPMTPDGIPVIGVSPYENLYLNTGQGHLGFTMACGSAKLVADTLLGEQPAMDTSGFRLERF